MFQRKIRAFRLCCVATVSSCVKLKVPSLDGKDPLLPTRGNCSTEVTTYLFAPRQTKPERLRHKQNVRQSQNVSIIQTPQVFCEQIPNSEGQQRQALTSLASSVIEPRSGTVGIQNCLVTCGLSFQPWVTTPTVSCCQ